MAVSAQEYVYALGLWTKNGLPTTMRHYVQRLLHDRRFDDILTLVQLLGEVAMYYYIQDGLVRERIEEARIVYEIGSQATDGPTVFSALKVTGYAGAIVRAAKNSPELALTVSQATQLMNEVRILRYMAGGFEIAGWAHNISGSFEDVGGCLYRELTELTDAP
ncbi:MULTISPECIES: hypothetical protein [Streptomyces]|uniref:hypothetical protein n=1 Tax=Streptomyces TaxID=1883 RepID=UPI0029B58D9A|nr:hypothetical protein [Streptomyces europaeiscabiei]MDX3715793.1 hypothetical protein [Streptomyces europaeiscabiei]WSG19969.1 hypothetical protein OHB30_02150 [Streptomyces europaeiscabiei]